MTVNFRRYLCNVRGSLGEQEKLCKDGPEAVVAPPPPLWGYTIKCHTRDSALRFKPFPFLVFIFMEFGIISMYLEQKWHFYLKDKLKRVYHCGLKLPKCSKLLFLFLFVFWTSYLCQNFLPLVTAILFSLTRIFGKSF